MFPFHTITDVSCGSGKMTTWPQVPGNQQQLEAAVPFDGAADGPLILTSHDFHQIFGQVAEEYVTTGFVQSDINAANAEVFNPGYTNSNVGWLAPTPAYIGASQDMMPCTYVPEVPRRKRPRDEEASSSPTEAGNRRSMPRRVKMKTGVDGVLGAAGSTSRARQKPAIETPVQINSKSEAAGRGADVFAVPIAHELYHQSLPGPSFQEALVGTSAQGQSPWIEGSEENVATTDWTGNAVGQQDVVNAAADEEGEDAEDGFKIPTGLSERNRYLLMATPEERARGVVGVLRCVICPKAGFKKWENFIRHCEQSEAHPETYVLCRFCGAFFARPDACKRHEEKRPHTCTSVGPAEAEDKRRVTQQVFEGYQRDLDAHLRFGRTLGEPFAQRIVNLYPDSAKRGSRQQNRLKS